jgi:hypothetical protein
MSNDTKQLPNIFRRTPDVQHQEMESLLNSAKTDMDLSQEVAINTNDVNFVDFNGSIALRAKNNEHPLTQYSMTQACRMAKIDTSIIRRLRFFGRNDLAIDNLNCLFPKNELKVALLNQNSEMRALNGSDYSRLWDFKIFDAVHKSLIPYGFKPAVVPYGCGQLLKAGHTALFRGDQTSFGFFFTDEAEVSSKLGSLRQGIMIWNSEVGARSFGFTNFYFREESGSFIIWDKNSIAKKRFVHRGDISKGFNEYMNIIKSSSKIATSSREQDMTIFNKAAHTPFASSVDEAIEKLNKLFDMNIQQATAVINASRLPQNSSGDDLSVWRISLGISYEAAQTSLAESMVDDSMIAAKVIRKTFP